MSEQPVERQIIDSEKVSKTLSGAILRLKFAFSDRMLPTMTPTPGATAAPAVDQLAPATSRSNGAPALMGAQLDQSPLDDYLFLLLLPKLKKVLPANSSDGCPIPSCAHRK